MTEVLVCCGVGGTGKTTTAAAMGVGQALAGKRAVVLTIDPARRLADALGLDELGNSPRAIEVPGAPGSLHALMLDRKLTFDRLVERHSSDPERARRILANRYYAAVSTRLTGAHEYMAIEMLHQLVHDGDWDVVIVDTPPARHVLDFFEAPDRVRRIFDRTVLKSMIQPGDGWLGGASQRALGIVHRLAGERVIADVAEFFSLVSDLSVGMRERHGEVATLLASDRTTYWLVAAAEAPERNDLTAFLRALDERGMRLGGFLLNRCAAPPPAGELGPGPVLPVEEPEAWHAALSQLVLHQRQLHAAHRSAAHRLSVRGRGLPVWMVPDMPDRLRTIDGLAGLAAWLPPNPAQVR